MKLKYKKMILLTTMSTMGIGLLTLSISHDKTDAKESISNGVAVNSIATDETTVDDAKALGTSVTTEPTLTPALSPTPTPLPVYVIEKEGTYPDIDKLIQKYYKAKNNRDTKALKSLLSDPTLADTQEELQKKTEYIEDYRNIKTFIKKGFKEGTFIVYAYTEIKFTSINTPAPGLAKFYIVTGDDNKLKIFSGVMDPEIQAYYDARNTDEDIVKLIEYTDKRSSKAIKSDEDLQSFWKNIDKMVNKKSKAQTKTADKTTDSKTNAEGDAN